MGVIMKLSSFTRKVGAAWAAAMMLFCGTSVGAQGMVYSVAGTFSNLSGATEFLPPGVAAGSSFTSQLTLDTSGYSAAAGSPGVVYTLPYAILSCTFINGSFETELTYTGLTLDFSASETGATSMEFDAGNANSAFALGYAGGLAPDNSLGSAENFLNAGFTPVTQSSAAQLSYYNPLPDGAPGVASGNLGAFSPIPEPGTDALLGLGLGVLARTCRHKFGRTGRPAKEETREL
jgi:hypothetical protein